MSLAIEVKDLTKSYGDLLAVNHVSLAIPEGVCFGILGPNGAGKTSFLEMLEGISKPTSGEIWIDGLNQRTQLKETQARMGVQLQENNYFNFLNLGQLLDFFISMYPKPRYSATELLGLVDLGDKRKALFRNLSGGQKQRFSIAVAMVNDPKILFLDEPTSGVDPQNRQYIWKLVTELKQQKKTIVLTTHYMDEAESLCEGLIIMDHGKIIAEGSPRELIRLIKGSNAISINATTMLSDAQLATIPGVEQFRANVDGVGWRLWTRDLLVSIRGVYEMAERYSITLSSIEIHRVTLEDVFLSLTGRELRE